MRDKLVATLKLVVYLVIVLFIYAGAAVAGNVSKAKDFMKAKMFPQAIALLKAEINKNPTNAEAHFYLGICYINAENFWVADERFESAVALEPKYGHKIGNEYITVGSGYLRQGDSGQAEKFFEQAKKYDPSLKGEIRQLLREYAYGVLSDAKGLSREKQDPCIREARKYLTKKEVDEVIPPPTWKLVPGSEKLLIGQGLDNSIKAAEYKREIKFGYRIVITAENKSDVFYICNHNKWIKYMGEFDEINSNPEDQSGTYFLVVAEKGIRLSFKLSRLE